MTEQQFTSQELAKLKAADPDGVISVRVEQIAEFIEQKGRLIERVWILHGGCHIFSRTVITG